MNNITNKIVQVFLDEDQRAGEYDLTDAIQYRRDAIQYRRDVIHQIIFRRERTWVHVTNDAYDFCNSDNTCLTTLAERIVNFLNEPNSSRILIHHAMDYEAQINFFDSIEHDSPQRIKKAYQFNNQDFILQLQIGGEAESDGIIINQNLYPNSRKSIKEGESIPDHSIWVPPDFDIKKKE